MRELFFKKSARLFASNYRLVLWTLAVLFAAAAVYLAIDPPRIESDILSLLPQQDPVVQDFKSALEDFKSIDHLFILIKPDSPDVVMEDHFEEIDEYVQRLKNTGLITSVEYRIQDLEPAIRDLLPYTFLYLKPEDIDGVSEAFSAEAIKEGSARNRAALRSPLSFYEKQLVRFDPFHLLPLIKGHFLGKSRKLKVDLSTGYYLSGDPKAPGLLMLVKPIEPAQNFVFGKKLMKALGQVEKDFRMDFPESKSLSFSYGGGYAINQSDSSLVVRDAIMNTLSSLVLVMLVTFFSFRAKSALVYGWLPLVSALFMTLFFMKLFGVTFNSATASVGALLIGLGIDFSTVLYGRFIQEKRAGAPTADAIETTMGHTFKSVATGAITTIAVFLVLLTTPFNGMRQVGILVAMGIFLVLLMNFLLFPPMIAFHDHHKRKKGKEPRFKISSFGISSLAGYSHKYPALTLILVLLVTAAFGVLATQISLDDSVTALRSSNNKGLQVTREINSRFGASFTYMMATVYGKSPAEISSKTKIISDSLDGLRRDGRVLFTDSLSTYLPPEENQKEVISKLSSMRKEGMTYERIERDFLDACAADGFDPAYFSDFLAALKQMVDPQLLTYDRLEKSPLAPFLDKFILKKADNLYRGVVYIYISEDFKRNEPSGLVSAVLSACPDAKVTGMNRLSRTLRNEMKISALRSFVIGMILVLAIILVDFKSLWLSLISLGPLFISMVWLIGTLVLLKEPLNMMNIFVTTMIIGIGSDYGVHVVHRYIHPGGNNFRNLINETCKPLIIAALTTIAGFGSLYYSSFPGLKSVGIVALFGTLYSMVTTLTFLVAVLTLMERNRKKKEA